MAVTEKEPTLTPEMVKWLAFGKRSIGSNTIFTRLSGIDALGNERPGYPRDPADLHRCILLLKAVPSFKSSLPKMASMSPEWGALIRNWNQLESSLISEVGAKWEPGDSAPNTSDLLNRVLP